MLLAGDVGGTKTALALLDGGEPGVVREAVLPSHDFPSLEAAVARFLEEGPAARIDAACFGVAGAVVDGRCVTTNLPWTMDEATLAAAIPAGRVRLLNDLEATGHGLAALPSAALVTLQGGTPRPGVAALIAAGTGLGMAVLVPEGRGWRVLPSEGGHADFAPRTEVEIGLLRRLTREFGRATCERVLSGPGLLSVYEHLRETRGGEPSWLRERLTQGDPSAAVAEVGLAGDHPLCVEALDLFASVYGATAGNLALTVLALGGVYVAGGIAPRLRAKLEDGTFMAAFLDKGRLRRVLEAVPVRLVMEPRTALLGAAARARALAGAA